MAAAPALSLFAVVAAAHALAVMSPGPDLAVVTRQTLAHGRAAGVRTALGIASGISVHIAYALFG
ncbi:MAG: LysE family transporter, partial [Nevskia sp.]|nr:LysE family transporter [Nevskia sp.]